MKHRRRPIAQPLALLLALAACSSAGAQATPAVAPPAAETAGPLEASRHAVRSATEWLARGVDGWFGDRPFAAAGGKVSDGMLSLGMVLRERESPDFNLRFNARVLLPNLEDRAFLFLGRDSQREVLTDKPETFTNQQRLLRDNPADRAFFAGLGFQARDRLQFRLGFRGGLKPYAHARYEHRWQWNDSDRIDFRETLFWSVNDRLGSTTSLSLEHDFSPTLAARWLSSATISQGSRRFEWASGLGLYRAFGDQRLLSLEALTNGAENSGVPALDYGLQLKWQQPVYQDWLLGEVLVGHFRPRPDAASPRSRAWALGGTLRMRF